MNEFFGNIKPKTKNSSSVMTIIMGHAGVGKTTLATTASQLGFTILVNFENRISHIDETTNLRMWPQSSTAYREDKTCNYEKWIEIVTNISMGKIKADYIIVDTIDVMFDIILAKKMETNSYKPMAFGNAYDEMNAHFKLLKNSGCNIICTAHVLNDPVLNKMTISLNEKLRNKINDQTDNIFMYSALEDESRILRLKSNDIVQCKLTTKGKEKYNNIESELINPEWIDIKKILWNDDDIIEQPKIEPEIKSNIPSEFMNYIKSKGFENKEDIKKFTTQNGISNKDIEKLTFLMNNKTGLDIMIEEFWNEYKG